MSEDEQRQSRCPHNGAIWDKTGLVVHECMERGWLCNMCREDRADARTDRLVAGLALAGLLAHPHEFDGPQAGPMTPQEAIRAATDAIAALRERGGGG